MKVMVYTLTVVAGLCFVSGLFILSDEGDNDYAETRTTYRLD